MARKGGVGVKMISPHRPRQGLPPGYPTISSRMRRLAYMPTMVVTSLISDWATSHNSGPVASSTSM